MKMSKREMYNMIAILVVTLILSLMLVLSTGCAYYKVMKTTDVIEITAISWRQLDTPYLNYWRDEDRGAGFIFSADEVTGPNLRDLSEAVIGLGDSLGIGKQTMLGVVGFCNQHPVMCEK
jgi:hypothetical protein